jgi:type II secretory pathway pseudopilin PulG
MFPSSANPRHDGESGFVLLAAIVLTVLLLISLAIAAPKIAQSIQRDKELEAVHRGEQYRLAIKLYYQKFGAYPTSVKQLLNMNDMRFLRQEYKDPLTGKKDWKPILFGQAHVRPLGFFGKPLSAVGGIAASGVMGGGMTPGMYAVDSSSTNANGSSTGTGSGSTPGSTNNNSTGTSSGGFGSSNSGMGGGMFSSGQSGLGGSSFGQSGFGSGGFGGAAGGAGSTPGFGSTTGPGSAGPGSTGPGVGTSATTFGSNGVGPIVGFTLPVKKASLIDYMEQTAYNKWEFNYDPAADMMQQGVSLLGGGATMNNSAPGTTALGASSTTMGSGSNSLFGSTSSGTTGTSGSSGSGAQNGGGSSTTNNPQSPNSGFPQ